MTDWTPESLVQFSGNYWSIFALHSAVELGVFTALADGILTEEALAKKLGCSLRGIELLTPALCAQGFLKREEGAVSLTDFARRYLNEKSPEYKGWIILHHADIVKRWSQLSTAIRAGRRAMDNLFETKDPAEIESFIRGMASMASLRAAQAVQAVDFSHARRLLDLGGGPGSYAVCFCQENPQLEAVIFDLPTSRSIAEENIAQNGLEGRIRFEGGNFFEDDLPKGFDLVWISHIIHSFDEEKNLRLLKRAMTCLNSAGSILIQEFILGDKRDGPLFSALFGLNMLVSSEGKSYTKQEIASLLMEAGAKDISFPMSAPDGSGIVMGRKP